jgi:ribosomal protein L13E
MKDAIKRGIVKTVSNGKLISRDGRGYSKNELIQSGITDIRVARKINIPIDPFRNSSREENIEQLKAFLKTETPKNPTKAKPTRVKKPNEIRT